MSRINVAQPDITLVLDTDGVIREVSLSNALSSERADALVGRSWSETVAPLGVDKVQRLVAGGHSGRVSLLRQITQCFPSGLELLMEYTTVRLEGKPGGLIAIGKSLQAVSELQSRLIAAQQAMERDYWKLREVETRYRLLFNASGEAMLLLRAEDLRVIEANPAAARALGTSKPQGEALVGKDFSQELLPHERDAFRATLVRVREQGKAPGMLLHLGAEGKPWLVRASLVASDPGSVYLIQLGTVAGAPVPEAPAEGSVRIDDLIARGPDGFVVINREGGVVRANRAFLDMVQAGAPGSVLGEKLGRWLGRPGADLTVLLANVRQHGVVRLFPTVIHGDLGSETETEISAVGDCDGDPAHIGLLLRDVGRKFPDQDGPDRLGAALRTLTDRLGKSTLRKLVRDTVEEVERHCIDAALRLTHGNRTAAAQLLGLSRQSLYAKLDRYGESLESHTSTGD